MWRVKAALALLRARRSSRVNVNRSRPRRVLVVCHGNIYRSAFAAEMLRLRAPELDVRSAGFHAVAGRRSPDRQLAMALRHGVDLSTHSSSVIGPADMDWADLVVLMDRSNWARLRRMGLDPARLAWIGAFAQGGIEIEDPYSLDDAAARRLLERLAHCTEELASALREPASQL